MDIPQYLAIKYSQDRKNYLQDSTPKVSYQQVSALWLAMITYINSSCVNQSASKVQNVKKLLEMKDTTVMYFIQKVLSSVIFNYLLSVLPDHMGNYHYHAGICKGTCGYGTNRIVAIATNTLIEMNISIPDIKEFPNNMILAATTAIESEAVRQVQGTGISYNFMAKNCSVPQPRRTSRDSVGRRTSRDSIQHTTEPSNIIMNDESKLDSEVEPYQLNMYYKNINI